MEINIEREKARYEERRQRAKHCVEMQWIGDGMAQAHIGLPQYPQTHRSNQPPKSRRNDE